MSWLPLYPQPWNHRRSLYMRAYRGPQTAPHAFDGEALTGSGTYSPWTIGPKVQCSAIEPCPFQPSHSIMWHPVGSLVSSLDAIYPKRPTACLSLAYASPFTNAFRTCLAEPEVSRRSTLSIIANFWHLDTEKDAFWGRLGA